MAGATVQPQGKTQEFHASFLPLLDVQRCCTLPGALSLFLQVVVGQPPTKRCVVFGVARYRERQRMREAERGALSAAELLALHESGRQPTGPHHTTLQCLLTTECVPDCAPSYLLGTPFLRVHPAVVYLWLLQWSPQRPDPCAHTLPPR
ncbi:hypothetical protein DFH08DRAFT_818771 [Mycena albidolilacea]|uniref:Uncharacterized protein n=1 Tax=Mycena albidolilacea TaxID=1033008 RepID=A0AAD6ZG84_9AGAR|nr:hypothetical protein DFH08DRAFT_818771 [Mycena albidolilacea]